MEQNSHAKLIPVGTMIRGNEKTLRALDRFIPAGIETVEIFFWDVIPDSFNQSWMEEVSEKCLRNDIKISTLGLYSNPLRNAETQAKAKEDWKTLLAFAVSFNIPIVSGFTGRIPGTALEESYEPVKNFYTPIAEKLKTNDIQLVFENCPMKGNRLKGDWNIAFIPEAWEILFNELFPDHTVGLEFDPAHCVQQGLPVLELLKLWIPRIYHIHGKDALGIGFGDFKFPGEGITDWCEIMPKLKEAGYKGSIDLEGYHDKFISHNHELERQMKSLDYLKTKRTC